MMNSNQQPTITNWAAYYAHRSMISKISAAFSAHSVLKSILKYARGPVKRIIELGGANTPLYSTYRKHFRSSEIVLLDREPSNSPLFIEQSAGDKKISFFKIDLLNDDLPRSIISSADIVFSGGLIEHFDERGTMKLIERHFSVCKPNGLVIISFPTPTFLYRFIRYTMEAINRWQFYDERPLTYDEVLKSMDKFGCIVERTLDIRLGLTQGKLVARKNDILS